MSNLGPAARYDSGYVLEPRKRSRVIPIAFWLVVIIGVILLIGKVAKGEGYVIKQIDTPIAAVADTGSRTGYANDVYAKQADYWATKGR
jgi:hypothetical protein